MTIVKLKMCPLWEALFGDPAPSEASFDTLIDTLVRRLPPAPPYVSFARPELQLKQYLVILAAPNGEVYQLVVEATDRGRALGMSWPLWIDSGLDMFEIDSPVKVSLLEIANA